MNDSPATLPPRRLLLATGPCARCDRPLVFMGSRSEDLLQRLGCDTLLVREEGGGDG